MQEQTQIKKVGILSCAAYIPSYRILVSDIAVAHGLDPDAMKELGVIEKSFAGIEDDSLTLAHYSAAQALENIQDSGFLAEDLEAVFVGSETHVYAVKPTSSMLATFLGCSNNYYSADLQFACKAGTAAIQVVYNMIKAGSIKAGLAVGTDIAKGAPADALEYTASSGAASFVLSADIENCIASIVDTVSFTSDMPDFWREEGSLYPVHAGRFSGTAYEKTITGAIKALLQKTKMQISDFDHVVLHMPNGKLPKVTAAKLGITEKQLEAGFIVPYIGNTYAACSPIGLTATLEKAIPNQNILVCSYGSGSGSDAFYIKTTDKIKNYQSKNPLDTQIKSKIYKKYDEYKLNEIQKYA